MSRVFKKFREEGVARENKNGRNFFLILTHFI